MPSAQKRGYSFWISGRLMENGWAAVTHADEIGFPMTLLVSINWTLTAAGDDPRGELTDAMMASARKWLRRNDVERFAYVETREAPCKPHPIPNTHMLIHVPTELICDFKRFFRIALDTKSGGLLPNALHFRLVGNGNPTLKAALGAMQYACKGIDPAHAARFHIKPKPQGRVLGKRLSVCQSIGPAARQRYAADQMEQVTVEMTEVVSETNLDTFLDTSDTLDRGVYIGGDNIDIPGRLIFLTGVTPDGSAENRAGV